MLFMSLLLYIALWIPYFIFVPACLPLRNVLIWVSPVFLYFFSFLICLLIVYLINSFNPETKLFLKKLLRLKGIRWIALLTGIVAVVSLMFVAGLKNVGPEVFGFLLPIGIISIINAFNIDFYPRMLIAEDLLPRIVSPPDFPVKPEEFPKDIVKDYKWEHKGQTYSLRLVIRRTIYENFKSKARIIYANQWPQEYVANGICGEIRELAHELLRMGKTFGTYDEVEFVLSFVQHIVKYQSEESEYPRYPVETLVDESGDCEDFSILGASLLKVMGYEVALLFLPKHVALGVAGATGVPGTYIEHKNNKYYYCEMTASGWQIGQIPEEYKNSKIEVSPIPGIAVNIKLT